MNHYQTRSKGTWGREEAKSAEELNRLCNEFFEKLVVPEDWKFLGWSNAYDNPLQGDTQNVVLLSVGKIFKDMRTNGINLKVYRIWFNSFSTRGGLLSKTIIDYGKFNYHSEVSNKTVEQLNEWIAEHYNELPLAPEGELEDQVYDKGDGLQHFRDRFGD